MQTLAEKDGTPTVLRALRFLAIRLHSREETKSLIPSVKAQVKLVQQAADNYEQAQEERMAASAEVEYRDHLVNAGVADLSRKALVETSNDRKDPFYVRLFPTSPSEATRGVGDDRQNKYVTVLLEQLNNLSQYKLFAKEAKELGLWQQELETALEQRNKLYQKEAQAQIEWNIALDNARRAYNRVYFQLQLVFDNKALIESFFRKLRTSRKNRSDESEQS